MYVHRVKLWLFLISVFFRDEGTHGLFLFLQCTSQKSRKRDRGAAGSSVVVATSAVISGEAAGKVKHVHVYVPLVRKGVCSYARVRVVYVCVCINRYRSTGRTYSKATEFVKPPRRPTPFASRYHAVNGSMNLYPLSPFSGKCCSVHMHSIGDLSYTYNLALTAYRRCLKTFDWGRRVCSTYSTVYQRYAVCNLKSVIPQPACPQTPCSPFPLYPYTVFAAFTQIKVMSKTKNIDPLLWTLEAPFTPRTALRTRIDRATKARRQNVLILKTSFFYFQCDRYSCTVLWLHRFHLFAFSAIRKF